MDSDELQLSHRRFSVQCFNDCWTLIDKPNRTSEDVENMCLLAQASLWHWKQRSDSQPSNLAIGYWQVSHVFALAGRYEMAKHFGERCLAMGREHQLAPFDVGYAYEALARAEILHGDRAAVQHLLAQARSELANVTDAAEGGLLGTNLTALEQALDA
jgi:hypothetical protein